MERRKSDRVPKMGEEVSCSDEMSPDEKSGAGAGEVITVKIPALDKYNLRVKSIQSRIELEKKKKTPVKKQPKAKQRPVPLSRYRRKTANARERTRMQEINDAFRELRSVIPELPEDAGERSDEYSDNASSSSKLTKITTLRLAVNYIAALSDILKQTDPPSDQSDASDSCASGPPPVHCQHAPDVLSSIALELDTLNAGDFPLTEPPDDVRDAAALRLLFDTSFAKISASDARCRPASGNSFDLPSYHSPSTTETDSIQSFTGSTGWEFASTEGSLGDVCENFDLILESEDGDGGY